MMKRLWVLLLGCILASGCFGLRGAQEAGGGSIFSVQVLRPDLVEKGGWLEVRPFKAGRDAEATDELDRFALKIISGVSDALIEEDHPIKFFVRRGNEQADLLIDGHIERFKAPGRMGRMLMKTDVDVVLEAEVRSVEDKELVALVLVRKRISSEDKGLEKEAYAIGRGIIERLLESVL